MGRWRKGVLFVLVVAVAAPGCYGKPLPVNDDAAEGCDPARILFVGDSLLGQSGPAIVDAFRAHGYENEIEVVFHGGSNVHEFVWLDAPTDFANPRLELQDAIDAFDPDVVVAEWGMNKVDSLWDTSYRWLMPWLVANDMQDVKHIVEDAGARLLWTTIPVRDGDPALDAYVNGVVNDQLIHDLGVPLVDWRAAVAPEDADAYAEFLKFHEDESVHPVRWSDGVHLAPDGAARVAAWTLRDLAPVACRADESDEPRDAPE